VTSPYAIEALADRHDRKSFSCGIEELDRYLASQATQDVRRRVATCFVAAETGGAKILAYYTLAATSFPLVDITPEMAKKLPRYPLVPAIRIGRLAVSSSVQGSGFGSSLLFDAMTRSVSSEIMAFAVVVDATNDAAAAFYRHNKFLPFNSAPLSLYLPLADFARTYPPVVK